MISREQLTARLKEAGFKFQRKNERSEIWKRRNGADRVTFTQRPNFTDIEVRSVLSHAGLTRLEIDAFFRQAINS